LVICGSDILQQSSGSGSTVIAVVATNDNPRSPVCALQGGLIPGEGYDTGMSVRLPTGISGDYFFIVQTDAADVVFELGSADLTPAGLVLVNRFAQSQNNGGSMLIEVHTDSQGSAGRNQLMSQSRADAIRAILVNAGIAEDRIFSVGLGNSQPLTANSSEASREANRRVELYIEEVGSDTN
jgi:outer membrane protein OmpA-like peptidoglycan-associated protein